MGIKAVLDWNEYLDIARKTVAEGCVLIKNDNRALPFNNNENIAVFGRIQNHYYKSGTGSGGLVNVSKVTSITDGLIESGVVTLNERLYEIYKKWEEENPYEEGMGWGNEPWSQKEMDISDEDVIKASKESDAALVIIGRTAGEDQDVRMEAGSFLLTELEMNMLRKVRKEFERMVVVLNVGAIMDMHFIDEINPDAVMYVWQGGMTGGSGTADVLTGRVSPSGKLTDTIAYEIEDYPSHKNFGGDERNFYEEDIYVGYRYFETFAKEKVRYPFGYGLSYTSFEMSKKSAEIDMDSLNVNVSVNVRNTGEFSGKEVVQLYLNPPQGTLGKPVRNLAGFEKTKTLAPLEEETVTISFSLSSMASYDSDGRSGHKSCFVLEKGEYQVFAGTDVRNASLVFLFELEKDIVVEELREALAPVISFNVMKPVKSSDGNFSVEMEPVVTAKVSEIQRRLDNLPEEIKQTGDKGIKLNDVLSGKNSMNEFIAQLSDEELCSLVRGEGMGSGRVTPGTASAFGGVSKALTDKGVPAVCCDDGPSGMRLDCGTKAFSLPNGTMIASTFNVGLVRSLYQFTGLEMINNNVECLLGPGMNIHRHPLNGRNFEYFSEDPYLTGAMACAMVNGLQDKGVTGTIKHFCGNNQEKRRHFTDSCISERALREIYLKGFEMAVKEAKASTVMTTYGSVNGLWTAGSYDLTTSILRGDWGFEGLVMTDWWAKINEREKEPNLTNFAAMVRAQNDTYMCCPNGESNDSGDNTMEELKNGNLTRGELQRTAKNVLTVAMNSMAMKRLNGTNTEVEIINREADATDVDMSNVEFVDLNKSITISLKNPESKKDANYVFAFDIKHTGTYKITVTGKSTLGELAQIPCTLFFNGFPAHVYTFHGSDGKEMSLSGQIDLYCRFAVLRLFVGANGVDLSNICFEYQGELPESKFV